MKKILFILVFLISIKASAQRESYSWIYGNCDPDVNNCQGVYGTAIIKFNDDSIESIRRVDFPSSFSIHASSISNSNGNLLLASNQSYIFDSTGNVLVDFITNDTVQALRSYRQSAYFLKLKDETDIYYFINDKTTSITPPINQPYLTNRTNRTYITKVKVNDQGYEILNIDTLMRNDTVVGGCMAACRHANGRDWWVFKSTFNEKEYLRGLLTPYGFEFELYSSPTASVFQPGGFNHFSSDGSKLFHYIPSQFRKMQIYDFDRCTGELSNFREMNFGSYVPYPPADFNPFVLSPDGSKIYMGRSNPDTYASYQNIQVDVETGQMAVVGDTVFVPCLSPNLKWVVAGYQAVPFTLVNKLNVYTQPNELGQECGRIKDLYSLFIDGFRTEPIEYANHLLGPIDGCSCDTLGIDDETGIQKLKEFSFQLFPNPGGNQLSIKTDLPLPVKLVLRDSQGKNVLEKEFNKNSFSIQQELMELNSGIYFVELMNVAQHKRLVRKWMKAE